METGMNVEGFRAPSNEEVCAHSAQRLHPASCTGRWEIFCRVIDNHGDAGVCWRLARELAARGAASVRLWIDCPDALLSLAGMARIDALSVCHAGVTIARWPDESEAAQADIGDVVIEAFACELPAALLARMAVQTPPPAWFNLEYLSAEDWVAGCHGLRSVHPQLGLVKRFCFPGFGAGTGGLLREHGLLEARDAWQADAAAQAAWLTQLDVPPAWCAARRISLFAYENPAVPGLFAQWARGQEQTCVLVPPGRVLASLPGGAAAWPVGRVWQDGALCVVIVPFGDQDAYDRLLWSCDLNFVRGEDSFVRAQWAARPLVWHIYPQEDGAHAAKLAAFLRLYAASPTVVALHEAWNAGRVPDWVKVEDELAGWQARAKCWSAELASGPELVQSLVEMVQVHV